MTAKPSYLPLALWDTDVLHLATTLSDAHEVFLKEKNWWKDYQLKAHGSVGGSTSDEARDHVINRFLNSAARMQFVCSDPYKNQPEVRNMVLDQLAQGEIFILDLAAGNGAGTLALLSLICELRNHNLVPKFPLNVKVLGIDHSEDALNYYSTLLAKISPWLLSHGVNASLLVSNCDLSVSGAVDEELESFFEDAKAAGVKRFLCTISALSGAKKEGFEKMHDSLKLVATRLSHKNRQSSWLWVEPPASKSWLNSTFEYIRLTLQRVQHVVRFKEDKFEIKTLAKLSPPPVVRSFMWTDPHNGKMTKSTVVVMQCQNL